MGKLKLLLLVVLAAVFAASTGFAAEKSFKAKLTSKQEVPSHKTMSSMEVTGTPLSPSK